METIDTIPHLMYTRVLINNHKLKPCMPLTGAHLCFCLNGREILPSQAYHAAFCKFIKFRRNETSYAHDCRCCFSPRQTNKEIDTH